MSITHGTMEPTAASAFYQAVIEAMEASELGAFEAIGVLEFVKQEIIAAATADDEEEGEADA